MIRCMACGDEIELGSFTILLRTSQHDCFVTRNSGSKFDGIKQHAIRGLPIEMLQREAMIINHDFKTGKTGVYDSQH